jgi:DNA-binding transcriptional LysR family regulator
MQADKTISRGVLDDLLAFAAVARSRSFSRAAAELNVSNSMLSYTIKRLENRLGYPLLRRTSRSVAPTAEGQTLLLTLGPALAAIEGALGNLSRIRDRISGTLRITATRQGYEAIIRPALSDFCANYPDATV